MATTTTTLTPNQMNAAQLRTYLAENGVTVPTKARKDDLVHLALEVRYGGAKPTTTTDQVTPFLERVADSTNQVEALKAQLAEALAQRDTLLWEAHQAGARRVDLMTTTGFSAKGLDRCFRRAQGLPQGS